MKKNIFQKQDDSEITEPAAESINETGNKVESQVETPSVQRPSGGSTDIINLVNISQIYSEHDPPNVVLNDFNLDIKDIKNRGQFITIMGKSGCGKSTRLYVISGLQPPSEGSIVVQGKNLANMPKKEMVEYPQTGMGMVLQAFYLISSLNVIDNICLPKVFRGESLTHRREDGIKPARINAAFNTFIWPLLGLIFPPWPVLMYLIVFPGGVIGWDWLWIGLAVLAESPAIAAVCTTATRCLITPGRSLSK